MILSKSTKGALSSFRFIVIQPGARMHYAVPALLAKAEMLEYFYTDVCGNIGIVGLLNYLLPQYFRTKPMERLFGRVLPQEISPSKVSTCSLQVLIDVLQKKMKIKKFSFIQPIDTEQVILSNVLKDDFLNANSLYTNCINSDTDIIRKAKRRGIRVVHEVMINADVGRILREERNLYPGIEPQDDFGQVEEGIQKDVQKWEMADLILVPSQFVYESTVQLGGSPDKIKIVPYGIDEDWFFDEATPERGRVLFVGSIGLRKGNHYLAQATRILKKRNINCDFRVVGPYELNVINHPEFQGPNYLGQCPRSKIKQEFLKADIFVLPTVSDSFALVHLEAMACGVPVITTPNCGSVVRDGVDGFIVPIRNAEILADRIEQLITDSGLRNLMSLNARQRARDFTWEKYGERLISAIQTLETPVM